MLVSVVCMGSMDVVVSSVFKTFRGKTCVVINSFKLTESNVLKNGNTRFRCCNKKCSASVVLDNTLKRVIEVSEAPHNHAAYSEEELAVQKMKVSLKRKAVESIKEKPTSMIRRELIENEGESASKVENSQVPLMRKVVYRARKKEQPAPSPKNLQEALQQLSDRQAQILTNGEQFCHVNSKKSMVIFTCSDNLLLLSKCSTVFGDGTFSFSPDHFKQLYTIHCHVNNFYVPVAYCFLTNKSVKTYELMWTELQHLCVKLVGKPFKVECFHADFEISAHIAVRNIFPIVLSFVVDSISLKAGFVIFSAINFCSGNIMIPSH